MDKVKLFEQVSQEDIYLSFLKLSKFPTQNISSPFSEDKNPSFRLYKNGTFKCHSTGKQGDVFQFVADLNNLDCKNQFKEVMDIICNEMNIVDTSQHFEYQKKPFEKYHLDYWEKWNVTKEHLQKYDVSALDKFSFYSSKTKQVQENKIFKGIVAFVYEVNDNAEIYIPKQAKKASKFNLNKTTKDDIFGFKQIENKVSDIIVCAGKKDALILNSNGFNAVSFRSENHTPTHTQIKELRSKCDYLFICYDNDKAGRENQIKIVEKYDLIPIIFNSKYNDIADLVEAESIEGFKQAFSECKEVAIARGKQDENFTIFHKTEKYLDSFYKFRYNEIKLDIEVCPKGSNEWTTLNENSLFIELQKNGIKISINNLLAILKSDYVPNYNPIKEYFINLPKWDGKTDHIAKLASYVKAIDTEQFVYHLKKWCVRTVKCAMLPDYFNKQAFILVHRGQNTGKSTFCRFMCPPALSDYIAEDITQDKDARILLCKNLLINLDELAGLNKKELTSLKSIFSKTQINERLPYDRKNSILPRICSFIGSTNEDNFLNDDTGSVRWLCFQITHIDWKYSQEIDINNIWSQAYALSLQSTFEAELTREDIQANEERNSKFQRLSTEQEIIATYIEKATETTGDFKTASDILIYLNPLNVRLNHIQIGKALSSLGYTKVKHRERQVYGYFVKLKPLFEVEVYN